MIDHDWIQKSLAEQSGSYKIKPEESKEAHAWLVKSSSLISQKKKGGGGLSNWKTKTEFKTRNKIRILECQNFVWKLKHVLFKISTP